MELKRISQVRTLINNWGGEHREQTRRFARRLKGRFFVRITPDQLDVALQNVSVSSSGVLFVHCSFSSCGYFTGGSDNVLDGLQRICQTLCMPTHTYCYPADADPIAPLFSADGTPSKTGILTEQFRHRSGVLRSIHSTHSLAACGPMTREICRDHYKQDTPCGAGTPYSTLVSLRASVLLFGVDFNCYTLFHTAEDASGSEFAYENGTLDRLRVVDEVGAEQDCWSRRQSFTPRRFAETGDLLESAGLVRRAKLGRGTLLFVPDCSKVHDFLVERLRRIPDFLYQSCAKSLQ